MTKISTKPPSGMRDFLPDEIVRRRYVTKIVREAYEAHGFVPLETPTIENLSTLLGKYGEEGDQLLYRVLHRRDALRRPLERAHAEGRVATQPELADQGLRYDLTVPLARVVAQYGSLPRFFKRYQIQPVWRADRPGRGRYRELVQCDVDIVGTRSPIAEAEVFSAASSALLSLGFKGFKIRLNHRELLRAIIRGAGISSELETSALVALDKLDKIGEDGVLKELEERGVAQDAAKRLLEITHTGHAVELETEIVPEGESRGPDKRAAFNAAVLKKLRTQVDEAGGGALDSLAQLLELTASGPAGPHVELDPTLARGLGYYTGAIYEVAVPDLKGSIGAGGRYDELVGMFGRSPIPAVGFSLGFERLVLLMGERGMYPELEVGPDVMLCWLGVPLAGVLGVASRLRAKGLRVEVFPEKAKLGKQIHYADAEGVKARFAAILGESELAAGELTVKHLRSGNQEKIALELLDRARLDVLATQG